MNLKTDSLTMLGMLIIRRIHKIKDQQILEDSRNSETRAGNYGDSIQTQEPSR